MALWSISSNHARPHQGIKQRIPEPEAAPTGTLSTTEFPIAHRMNKDANRRPKLSRRLARYHLAMALFPSPLAERSMTVSVSLRSPAVNLVASQQQVTFSTTLALRLARTAWQLRSDYLCPFALWTTFSSSLVSRNSHDYYEHSVSLEVSLRRKSRVPSR